MTRKHKRLLFHSLLATFVIVSAADALVAHPERNEIGAKVDSLFAEWDKPGSPGAAMAVVQDGKVLYTNAYGTANLELDVPITSQTVFYIGSVGKQLTAFAVALLADEGKLSLDHDIRTYLPELHDFGQSITLRNLIHHTSGLRDYFGLLALAGRRDGDLITQEHVLHAIERQRELNYSPGTEYLYSNSNYALLATIVERVTGKTFSDWMHERVFKPLGMRHTLVVDDHERIIKQRAASYRLTEGVEYKTVVLPYSAYGAGGIYSTVTDLARWVSNFEEPKVGDLKTIAQMYQRGILNSGDTLSYAFALGISEYRDLKRIGHSGSLAGYRAYVGRFPDKSMSIIVLSNLASFDAAGLAMQVADLYLAEYFTKPKSDSPVKDVSKLEAVEIDPEAADDCAGDYEVESRTGVIATFWREGDQYFAQATEFPAVELFPASDSTFFNKDVDLFITFHRKNTGKVSRYTSQLQGATASGLRIQLYRPSPEELSTYAGRYYSPELETAYTLMVEDGKLIAKHRRHSDFEIRPIEKNRFHGDAWFFREVRFERDSTGRITSLRVSNGRTRNILLEKQ